MVYFETILGSKRVFHLREVEEGHFLPYFANWKKTQTRWCHLTGKMHISFSLLSRPCSRLSYQRTFAASHQPGGKSSFSATVHKSQMSWKDKNPFKRRNFVTDEKVFTVHWGPRSCKGRKHYLFLKMLGAKLCINLSLDDSTCMIWQKGSIFPKARGYLSPGCSVYIDGGGYEGEREILMFEQWTNRTKKQLQNGVTFTFGGILLL